MRSLLMISLIAAISAWSCKSTQPGNTAEIKPAEQKGAQAAGGRQDMDVEEPLVLGLQRTASGLEYEILEPGYGRRPAHGDKVTVHYAGTLEDGSEFDNSFKRGEPFSFKLGKGQVIKGWDEGIALLNVGTRARLFIPAELGYGAHEKSGIPANSRLVFEVQIIDAMQILPPKPFDTNGTNKIVSPTGLTYYIVQKGSGPNAESGKTVTVHYTGYLLDGKMFDSSVERGNPLTFELGKGRVIKGWDEGIALLNTGAKARLIIPPNLGYGEGGYPPIIPANSTLIFDVELIEIK